ncbi:hypothetical protein HDU97_003993 [Phlyctochytrium planicorne]|nr:hypothetical protein HDU97_003993 [Phlyctochytrium planicorne]
MFVDLVYVTQLNENYLSGKIPSWAVNNTFLSNNCFTSADFPSTVLSTRNPQRSAEECAAIIAASTTQSSPITPSSSSSQTSGPQPSPSSSQTSTLQPQNPTTEKSNSPQIGLIAGTTAAGILILATIAVASFIIWKRKRILREKLAKNGAATQNFEREPPSEPEFLVSKSTPSSSSSSVPEVPANVVSEASSSHFQQTALSTSEKHGGLFSGAVYNYPAAGAQGVSASTRKERAEVDENDRKKYFAGNTNTTAWPADIKSPSMMQEQEQGSSASASPQDLPSTTTLKGYVNLIFEKNSSAATPLSAPPRGASTRAPATSSATITRQPLSTWSVDDVARWLDNDLGLKPDVVEILKGYRVTGTKLLTLTDADLVEMGLSQGYARLAILAAVADLSNGVNGSPPSSDVPPPYIGL